MHYSAKDAPARGTVVSVVDGIMTSDGSKIPLQLKPSDRIIFSSYAGEAISVDDDELLLMREADVLAVIE